jgi:hypothetical protein
MPCVPFACITAGGLVLGGLCAVIPPRSASHLGCWWQVGPEPGVFPDLGDGDALLGVDKEDAGQQVFAPM